MAAGRVGIPADREPPDDRPGGLGDEYRGVGMTAYGLEVAPLVAHLAPAVGRQQPGARLGPDRARERDERNGIACLRPPDHDAWTARTVALLPHGASVAPGHRKGVTAGTPAGRRHRPGAGATARVPGRPARACPRPTNSSPSCRASRRAGETRRDHGHPDLAAEALVDGRAEDDVRLVGSGAADDLGCLVHLEQREVMASRDREEDAACPGDLGVDQWRAERAFGSLPRASFGRLRVADAHERRAGVGHDGADVGEVEVDEARHRDQVADPLHALAEDVVGNPERVDHRRRPVEHLEESVVRDHDHGVALAAEELDTPVGRGLPARALEAERRRDDADGERPEVARDPRHDGRCAGAGAAALPGGDEDHVRTAQDATDLVGGLLGRLAADLGVSPRAEPLREDLADVDLGRRVREGELLRVRVDGDEVDLRDARVDHAVDGVEPASADADDLDHREVGPERAGRRDVESRRRVGHGCDEPARGRLRHQLVDGDRAPRGRWLDLGDGGRRRARARARARRPRPARVRPRVRSRARSRPRCGGVRALAPARAAAATRTGRRRDRRGRSRTRARPSPRARPPRAGSRRSRRRTRPGGRSCRRRPLHSERRARPVRPRTPALRATGRRHGLPRLRGRARRAVPHACSRASAPRATSLPRTSRASSRYASEAEPSGS